MPAASPSTAAPRFHFLLRRGQALNLLGALGLESSGPWLESLSVRWPQSSAQAPGCRVTLQQDCRAAEMGGETLAQRRRLEPAPLLGARQNKAQQGQC